MNICRKIIIYYGTWKCVTIINLILTAWRVFQVIWILHGYALILYSCMDKPCNVKLTLWKLYTIYTTFSQHISISLRAWKYYSENLVACFVLVGCSLVAWITYRHVCRFIFYTWTELNYMQEGAHSNNFLPNSTGVAYRCAGMHSVETTFGTIWDASNHTCPVNIYSCADS
jgi:hypothetical protein